jgi:hypothetical protein
VHHVGFIHDHCPGLQNPVCDRFFFPFFLSNFPADLTLGHHFSRFGLALSLPRIAHARFLRSRNSPKPEFRPLLSVTSLKPGQIAIICQKNKQNSRILPDFAANHQSRLKRWPEIADCSSDHFLKVRPGRYIPVVLPFFLWK